MELRTTRLILTSLTVDHVDDIHHLHSLPVIDEFNTLGIPDDAATTKSVVGEWLSKQQAQPRQLYVFVVKAPDTKNFIGLIGLKIGKPKYRIGEVWYKTLPAYWNKGFTTEALLEVLRFSFTNLQLHRIEAGCAVNNTASIRVLEKAGMIREGQKREILPIRGKWVDNYIYSILDREFGAGFEHNAYANN